MGHMADVAKWEAKAGTPKGGSSNNYQPNNNGCWSGLKKIVKWGFILFVFFIIFSLLAIFIDSIL